MKKRVLFTIHYLELGGAEMSLVGLLQSLDYSRVDADLFVYSHQGELMKYIPPQVRLLPEIGAYAHIERPMKEALASGYMGVVYGRLKAKWRFRQYARKTQPKDGSAIFQYVMDSVEPHLPSLADLGEYDLAVSFLTPHNIVLNKVLAKKKVCWIHTDYSRIDISPALELPVWSGYDKIVSISGDVTREFLKVFPSLENKVVEMHNILPASFVRERAEEMSADEVAREMPREAGVANLLSVGRFSYPKNYDNVPNILRRINGSGGRSVKWYLIGYGGDEPLIRQKIAEEGMEGQVVILGKKENPYPYMKACDLYVQPSRYEGNAVTVREAQMLGKPVAIANYETASSQVCHGKDGIIVPQDNEGCARGIARLLDDKAKQQAIAAYLQTHDYGNTAEAEKLYELLSLT